MSIDILVSIRSHTHVTIHNPHFVLDMLRVTSSHEYHPRPPSRTHQVNGPSKECAAQFSEPNFWTQSLKKTQAAHEYQSAHQDGPYFDTKHSRKGRVWLFCSGCLCTCLD